MWKLSDILCVIKCLHLDVEFFMVLSQYIISSQVVYTPVGLWRALGSGPYFLGDLMQMVGAEWLKAIMKSGPSPHLSDPK